MKKFSVVVLTFMLIAAAAQSAVEITTAVGSGADGWISNDAQSGSYKSESIHNTTGMQVRYNGGGSRFKAALMRFDISSVAGTIGDDTYLQLGQTYTKGSDKVIDVYGLVDGHAGEAWDETTLCYDNAPGFLNTNPTNDPLSTTPMDAGWYAIDSSLVWLGTFIIPGTGSGGATITPPKTILTDPGTLPLASFLNADTNGLVTLVLINAQGTSTNNSENRFASKEDANGGWPTLVIVPEPATLLILGLGGLLAMRKK